MKKFKSVLFFTALILVATSAFAQGEVVATNTGSRVAWGALAAAIVLAIPAAGGAIGQGMAVSAACTGIARNPSAAGAIRLAMIIGLALIESLVIYALVIAFLVMNK